MVTTGDSDGSHTEVLSGLKAGTEVIVGQLAADGESSTKRSGSGSGGQRRQGGG